MLVNRMSMEMVLWVVRDALKCVMNYAIRISGIIRER